MWGCPWGLQDPSFLLPWDSRAVTEGAALLHAAGCRSGLSILPGKTVVHQLSVSLEDLYNGTTRKLSLQKNIICRKCGGEGLGGTETGGQHRAQPSPPTCPRPQAAGCGRAHSGGAPSATARAWRCVSTSWGPA